MTMEAPVTRQPVPEQSKRRIPTHYIVIGVVVALLLLVLLGWLIVWAAINHGPVIEALRDIFIIALALESCIFGVILVIMLVMVVRLVNMLEFEIKPILEKTNETVGMVRGTTTFVGENVVKPVTKATAYVVGIRQGLKVLFGDPKRNLPD
jgi:membrane protein implicated in regulation of membrane protease activity